MFTFRTRAVADHPTQLNFEQLSRCLPGKRYSAPFTALAAGAGVQTTVIVDPLPPTAMVLGSVNYTGAVAFQDACSWAWRQTASNAIEVSVHNNAAVAATGTLYFSILGFQS